MRHEASIAGARAGSRGRRLVVVRRVFRYCSMVPLLVQMNACKAFMNTPQSRWIRVGPMRRLGIISLRQ